MVALTVPCRHGARTPGIGVSFFMGKHYARRVRIITVPSKDTGGQGKQLP